jgi:hypothetical protein
VTDYYGNQPPNPYQQQPDPYQQQNPYPQPQSNPFPSQNPYQQPQSNPFPAQNPYQPNPPSNPFPSPSYPQSPPTGMPSQTVSPSFPQSGSFPSYYTSSQPAQEPQQPKSKAKVLLIVAALVMFVAAGVFAGLYVTASNDHDKAASTLEEKKTELADVKKNITSAEESKSNAEKANGDLKSQKDALQPCVDATMYFLWEAPEAELGAAVQRMRDVCK